jgi:hypothetical protein
MDHRLHATKPHQGAVCIVLSPNTSFPTDEPGKLGKTGFCSGAVRPRLPNHKRVESVEPIKGRCGFQPSFEDVNLTLTQ